MNLLSTRKTGDKPKLLEASVILWTYCNLKCPYCFGTPSKPPQGWDLAADERLGALEAFLSRTGPWSLTVSGGEPTLHPRIDGLVTRLHGGGHQVNLISNGSKPFREVFRDGTVRALSSVTLSCQSAHESSRQVMGTFKENIEFLRSNGVEILVNYVVYPGRTRDPLSIVSEFAEIGVRVRFKPFMGEYSGKEYPYDYTEDERRLITGNGDLDANFITKHGHYTPTFKRCRAGFETFYISMNTGGVFACESLLKQELVNLLQPGAAELFAGRRRKAPLTCSAKRCFCWPTVEQEEFLGAHDMLETEHYDEWERISLPSEQAAAHWDGAEEAFVQELSSRLRGERVVVWGGGAHSLALLSLLARRGFPFERFVAIVDRDPKRQGRTLKGTQIISRAEFEERHARSCSDILISSRAYEREIRAQLENEIETSANILCLYDGAMRHQLDEL